MHITAMMVMSADGRVTRGDETDVYSWTSKEDGQQFFERIGQSKLIVMGKHTYIHAKPYIKLKPETRRVVLCSDPSSFSQDAVLDQLEFSSSSPPDSVARLESMGYKELLLVGGSHTLGSFLRAGLINELFVTIEPWVFGSGQPLITLGDGMNSDIAPARLTLLSLQKLNEVGTILLHYSMDEVGFARLPKPSASVTT